MLIAYKLNSFVWLGGFFAGAHLWLRNECCTFWSEPLWWVYLCEKEQLWFVEILLLFWSHFYSVLILYLAIYWYFYYYLSGAPPAWLVCRIFQWHDVNQSCLTRLDAQVDFDWGFGSPDPSVPVDCFSARWSGQVMAKFSEEYVFHTVSDGGVRLWINEKLLIDNWTDHSPVWNVDVIILEAGRKYSIKMEFYENQGIAVFLVQPFHQAWNNTGNQLYLPVTILNL